MRMFGSDASLLHLAAQCALLWRPVFWCAGTLTGLLACSTSSLLTGWAQGCQVRSQQQCICNRYSDLLVSSLRVTVI
jgi:hypothetical protein